MEPTRTVSRRRHRLTVIAALAVGLAAFPLGAAVASHQFGDVITDNPYHADIDALADAGVTTGCGGGNFCPSGLVTREQMAAFMNRLGALAPGKTPVVNATKLDGLDSTAFVKHGQIVEHLWGPIYAEGNAPPTSIEATQGNVAIGYNTSGNATVILPLSVPRQIGGLTYGWAEAEVCFGGAANVTLINWSVFENQGDGSYGIVAADSADHSLALADCFTLDATAWGGVYGAFHTMGIALDFQYAASSIARLAEVTVTWAPYTP